MNEAKQENTLNVRRLVGAILLALTGFARLLEAMDVPNIYYPYRDSLIIIGLWSGGIAIWYFVTLTKPTIKVAEMIVKVLFIIMVVVNALAGIDFNATTVWIYALGALACYAIGCPWGAVGYKKHPYKGYEDLANRREKIKNEHK